MRLGNNEKEGGFNIKIKINDKTTLGVIVGSLANIIRNIIGILFYMIDFKNYTMFQIAASSIVPKEKTTNVIALAIGIFTDYSIASILGIVTVFFLYFTGTQNYLLKGFMIGSAAWLIVFIPITQSNVSRINPDTLSSNISFLIGHLLLGVLMSYFAIKIGKPLLEGKQ